jgi:hypothetical protein
MSKRDLLYEQKRPKVSGLVYLLNEVSVYLLLKVSVCLLYNRIFVSE